MKARSSISLFLICLLGLSFLALYVPKVWAWDWAFLRPVETGQSYVQLVNQTIHGANTTEKASVGLGVDVAWYHENDMLWPFEGNDGLRVRMVATGNTRKIINYTLSNDDYYWHDNLPNQLSLGDDAVEWIDALGEFGYKFRFYGGVGSAEYEGVWISSNGVLFFNDTCTDRDYFSVPPNTRDPDNFIAPFWRDLKPNQGGSITYGIVQHPSYNPVFCLAISWNNVPDANGNPQTFQVIIEPARTRPPHDPENYWQSRIWFQYKNITLDMPTTVGIEDQLGERGNQYNYWELSNETTLEFAQHGNYAVITSLTVEMVENDIYSYIEILNDPNSYRGANVDLQPAPGDGDSEMRYWMALGGTATLLLDLSGVPPLQAAGLILGVVLWGVDTADTLAASAKKAEVEINDTQPDGVPNYALAPAYESTYQSFPVDAWFGIQFYWVFTDPNNQIHILTVRTKLAYEEYTKYGTPIGNGEVTTSKTLFVQTSPNSPPATPSTPVGQNNGNVGTSYNYRTTTTDPDDTDIRYTFDWGDGSNTTTSYYPSEYLWANASHTWGAPGTYEIRVIAQDYFGAWSNWSSPLTVTITEDQGGGGGGCPTLFSWNGTAYTKEALLDIHSNLDVTVNYTLNHLTPINRLLPLSLRELDNFTSHIDYVKLYVADNRGIKHECPLFIAWHNKLGLVKDQLSFDDDEKIDLALGERTELLFLLPKNIGSIQYFIFELNGHNPKHPPLLK